MDKTKDAEAEALQQESEELDRWQRVWAGKNAMTATAFGDLKQILDKAGSPAAGALVVPNGKKGAALDPQVTASTLSAVCGVLTLEEWQTLMPVLIEHCPTQPEPDEPEAQAEPQPEPEQDVQSCIDEDGDFIPD